MEVPGNAASQEMDSLPTLDSDLIEEMVAKYVRPSYQSNPVRTASTSDSSRSSSTVTSVSSAGSCVGLERDGNGLHFETSGLAYSASSSSSSVTAELCRTMTMVKDPSPEAPGNIPCFISLLFDDNDTHDVMPVTDDALLGHVSQQPIQHMSHQTDPLTDLFSNRSSNSLRPTNSQHESRTYCRDHTNKGVVATEAVKYTSNQLSDSRRVWHEDSMNRTVQPALTPLPLPGEPDIPVYTSEGPFRPSVLSPQPNISVPRYGVLPGEPRMPDRRETTSGLLSEESAGTDRFNSLNNFTYTAWNSPSELDIPIGIRGGFPQNHNNSTFPEHALGGLPERPSHTHSPAHGKTACNFSTGFPPSISSTLSRPACKGRGLTSTPSTSSSSSSYSVSSSGCQPNAGRSKPLLVGSEQRSCQADGGHFNSVPERGMVQTPFNQHRKNQHHPQRYHPYSTSPSPSCRLKGYHAHEPQFNPKEQTVWQRLPQPEHQQNVQPRQAQQRVSQQQIPNKQPSHLHHHQHQRQQRQHQQIQHVHEQPAPQRLLHQQKQYLSHQQQHRRQQQNEGLSQSVDDSQREQKPCGLARPLQSRELSPPSPAQSQESTADGEVSVRLFRFLLDELESPVSEEERLLAWVNRDHGLFRIVRKAEVANKWGRAKNNQSMTYEKFSRSLRYYYRVQQLERVRGHELLYRFSPRANPLVWKTIRASSTLPLTSSSSPSPSPFSSASPAPSSSTSSSTETTSTWLLSSSSTTGSQPGRSGSTMSSNTPSAKS